MSAEDQERTGRHVGGVVHEDRPLLAQALDDVAVVNDFVPHEDRRTETLEGELHDLDGAIHSRTEAPRVAEQNTHQSQCSSGAVRGSAVALN